MAERVKVKGYRRAAHEVKAHEVAGYTRTAPPKRAPAGRGQFAAAADRVEERLAEAERKAAASNREVGARSRAEAQALARALRGRDPHAAAEALSRADDWRPKFTEPKSATAKRDAARKAQAKADKPAKSSKARGSLNGSVQRPPSTKSSKPKAKRSKATQAELF